MATFFNDGVWGYLEALAALSLLTFLISLVCIPVLIAMLPRDYFHPARPPWSLFSSPAAQLIVLCLRNVIGFLLFCAGVAMLFLPGQGIITIIIGIAVMRFPYKRAILLKATRSQSVRKSLDWIRRKMKKEPFLW